MIGRDLVKSENYPVLKLPSSEERCGDIKDFHYLQTIMEDWLKFMANNNLKPCFSYSRLKKLQKISQIKNSKNFSVEQLSIDFEYLKSSIKKIIINSTYNFLCASSSSWYKLNSRLVKSIDDYVDRYWRKIDSLQRNSKISIRNLHRYGVGIIHNIEHENQVQLRLGAIISLSPLIETRREKKEVIPPANKSTACLIM